LTLNDSDIISDTLGAKEGTAIDIVLPQGMLEMRNGSRISATSEGAGKGSNLQIEARTIFISDDGSEFTTGLITQSISTGNGGNIKVTTDSLEVVNGAEISAKTFGAGNGGNILLDANSVMLSRDGADAGTGVFTVTTSTGNAGDLTIQSNSLDVNAGASIFTTTLEDSGRGGVVLIETESLRMSGLRTQISATSFDKGNSQDIIIKTGSLELRDGAVINTTVTEGTGKSANLLVEAKDIVFTGFLSGILGGSVTDSDAGNVTLIADNLEIQNGAGITTPALGKGSGGDITVTVENLLLSDSGSLITKTDFDSHGDSGSIIINADNLEVRDRGLIDTSALGTGNSGDLLITADNIVIAGGNLLSSASFKNSGDAGAITIKAENLEVRNGSGVSNDTEVSTDTVTGITSSTSGGGRSGDITIEARNILLSGKHTGISASTLNAGNVEKTGDAGTITFVTDNLELRDGTRVNTSTFSDSGSSGNGGDIVVTAGNILLSGGGSLEALTGDGNAGNAGNIDITTDNLEVRQGSDIATTTRGTGSAGDVAINAGTLLLSSDGATDFTGIRSSTTGAGSAGDIRIEAKNVQLSGDESSRNTGLFSNSLDVGDAGAITIAADDSLRILDGASISVIAKSADAGDITISADNLLQLSDGQLTTSVAEGTGNGGNILIGQQPDSEGRVRVPDMTVLENSEIIAQAEEGNGGKINITSDFIFRSVSTVDASTGEGGIDGTVNISSPETNISGSIVALSETYINASEHLSERCAARSANVSSFVVKDRSTIRPGPEDAAPSTFYENDQQHQYADDTMANSDGAIVNNILVAATANSFISDVSRENNIESVFTDNDCGE
jgi:large exoprotein involved in heme utilization and adhesion